MPQKSVFTTITPLPLSISRETAIAWIHDHTQMIKLNPLVIRHDITEPPPNATFEEYIPGLPAKGEVTYKAAFYDLPNGLQTHVFAPGGVDIRGHWSIGGNLPGEPREPLELGSELPRDRLFLKEHVVLRCNLLLTAFVKKNLKKSHASLVQNLFKGAVAAEQRLHSLQDARNETEHRRAASATITSSVGDYSGHNVVLCNCRGDLHDSACQHYLDHAQIVRRPHILHQIGMHPGQTGDTTYPRFHSALHERRSLDRAELAGKPIWPQDQHELPAGPSVARRCSSADIYDFELS